MTTYVAIIITIMYLVMYRKVLLSNCEKESVETCATIC